MIQFIGAIITFPFKVIKAIYNRFGPGGLIVFFSLILIIFLGYKFISARNARLAELTKPPTTQEAPYMFQTSSRVYLVKEYHQEGDTLVMDKYYGQDSYQWKYYDKSMPLPKKAFGDVTPMKR